MYFSILVIGLILAFINNKITFKFYWLMLTVIAIVRYGIGSDYFAYDYMYNRFSYSLANELINGIDKQEIGFRLFGTLVKMTGATSHLFIALFAIINMFYIGKLSKKYSSNPTLSLVIYFSFYYLTWTFSAIRQGIVIPIGIYYLLEFTNRCRTRKNDIKFFTIIIGLSLIHVSALIIAIIFIMLKLNINRNRFVTISILIILFSVLPLGSILYKLSFIPIFAKISNYLDTSIKFNNILDFQSIARLGFLLVAIIFYNPLLKNNKADEKIINIYIYGLLVYFIFKSSELTAARLSIYGKILDIILFPNIISLSKIKFNKLVISCIVITLCTFYLYKDLRAMSNTWPVESQSKIPPYINIFNRNNYLFHNKYLPID